MTFLAVCCLLLGAEPAQPAKPVEPVVWDLSRSRKVEQVAWPKDHKQPEFALDKEQDLRLILPEFGNLDMRVVDAMARCDSPSDREAEQRGEVTIVYLQSIDEPLLQAVAKARGIAKTYDVDLKEDFDEWLRTPGSPNVKYEHFARKKGIEVGLSIRRAYTQERRYSVVVVVSFPEKDIE
jgi:hypothetical protein